MKIIFTALSIIAISAQVQAAPQIDSGAIGMKGVKIGDRIDVKGFVPLPVDTIATTRINQPVVCGGLCTTNLSPIPMKEFSAVNQFPNMSQAPLPKYETATVPTHRELKQLQVPSLPNLSALSPSAGNNAHPELMNLSTIVDDTQLSAAQ